MQAKPSTISKALPTFLIFFLLIQLVAGVFWFVPKPQETKADGESWYDSNWLYRKTITVDNSSNDNTLTDYQVEISLTTSDFNFLKAQMFGQDIIFTDDDGTTLINHWIEAYNPIKSANIWVKVPSVPASSTKTIYMYYGNSSYTNTTYQTYHVSVDSTAHNDYGLSYPVTYEFLLPANSSGLKAYKRYSTGDAWTQLTEKTSDDFFNGIEAVRFDYTSNGAYVSVAFGPDTDDIYIKFTDSIDNPISFSYIGASEYYDNRDATVAVTGDDWHPSNLPDQNTFETAANILRDASIWFSVGIITDNNQNPAHWVNIQNQINAGYVEPCSHSRSHSHIPYDDYDSEIGGSQSDIINNLDMPSLNKKGSQEYMTCWFGPYGQHDAIVYSKLGQYHYLTNRGFGSFGGVFRSWDAINGVYEWHEGYIWDTAYNPQSNLEVLNGRFDSAVSNGEIYMGIIHPAEADWSDGSFIRQHIDYIKQKKNLWYVGAGHLYTYHYVQEKIAVSGFVHSGDLDNTFTKETSANNLAMDLHMDEGSGNSINDSSGNGYNGTKYGSTSWVGADGGVIGNIATTSFSTGNALNFNGTSTDYVDTVDLSWATSSSFTISGWIKPDNVSTKHTVIGKYNWEYTLYVDYDVSTGFSYPYFRYYDNAGVNSLSLRGKTADGRQLEAGKWYHIVVTYDGGTSAKIYVNGYNDGVIPDAGLTGTNDVNFTGTFKNTTDVLRVGSGFVSSGTNYHFDGVIDEVRIYNRALSQGEITALYERRKYTTPEPTLTVGSEDGYPIAVTIGVPSVIGDTVRWNFTDNSDYETGFKLYDGDGNLISTQATPDLSYIDETGLALAIQHTRYIKAYNSYGESSASGQASIAITGPSRTTSVIDELISQITTTQNNTSTTSTQATTTQQTSTTTEQDATFQTPLTKEAQIRQIRSQIADIQQKLIILISRLIQLLQEQLSQL